MARQVLRVFLQTMDERAEEQRPAPELLCLGDGDGCLARPRLRVRSSFLCAPPKRLHERILVHVHRVSTFRNAPSSWPNVEAPGRPRCSMCDPLPPEMPDATNPYEHGLAYVDGSVVPLAEARIPLVDAGFTRSDVTYDVVAVWKGSFFRLPEHLERFRRSRELMRLEIGFDDAALAELLIGLVAESALRDAYVSMIATRGTPPTGSRDPRNFRNRLYAFACPYLWVFSPELQERGIRAIVSSTIRTPPAAFDPTIKNFQWGDLMRGLWEALDDGAEAGILLDRDGNVTEGAGFNVFAVVDGAVRTPADGALLGITRRTVLELAREEGLPTRVGPLHVDELRAADEVFFTTTAGGVMPVASLDGKPNAYGGPGPISLRLRTLYWEAHERPEWSTPVDYEQAADEQVAGGYSSVRG